MKVSLLDEAGLTETMGGKPLHRMFCKPKTDTVIHHRDKYKGYST